LQLRGVGRQDDKGFATQAATDGSTAIEMERAQCLYENEVKFNHSESGVPLSLDELLPNPDQRAVLTSERLCCPHSMGRARLRQNIAVSYDVGGEDPVTVTNGGSEANFMTLWGLVLHKSATGALEWRRDLNSLKLAVKPSTKVIVVTAGCQRLSGCPASGPAGSWHRRNSSGIWCSTTTTSRSRPGSFPTTSQTS
jgi:hypothetical protein